MLIMLKFLGKNAKRLIAFSFSVIFFLLSSVCVMAVDNVEGDFSALLTADNSPVITFTIDKTSVQVGDTVEMTIKIKNGTGKPNYLFTFKEDNTTLYEITTSQTSMSYTWTATTAGKIYLKGLVTDSDGSNVYSVKTVTVTEKPTEQPTEKPTEKPTVELLTDDYVVTDTDRFLVIFSLVWLIVILLFIKIF